MTPDFKDVLGNAEHLFSMHPAPWQFYYPHGNGYPCGYVVDGNHNIIFGGMAHEGYVSEDDPEVVAIVDLVNSLAVYMKGDK